MPGCRVDPLTLSVIKTALTAAALGITGYSRVLGRKVSQETSVPVFSGTEPSATTPPDVARAQTRLKLLQWAVPSITGPSWASAPMPVNSNALLLSRPACRRS